MSHKGEGQVSTVRVNMGVTTKSLIVDDVNPTGLPQVFEESVNGVVTRQYTYGLQRISENQVIQGAWTPSFYGYDGFGSVRQLTDLNAIVTDKYNYDAFGNLLSSPGPTPNNYLYRGEQFDSDLGLYYLRARYYNPQTGRFLSRDPEDGNPTDPKTLHKYLYADGDPVNAMDPRGREAGEEYSVVNFDLVEGGSKLSPLEEFGQTSARILCRGIETVAKITKIDPGLSGPYLIYLRLIQQFADICIGLGY